jgi:tRNA threonylcarbamoyladenosine biosynthesis protein TsaE
MTCIDTDAHMRAFAGDLARTTAPGTVIGLVGPLGAGKTTFVQGFAAGWGVADLGQVVSPTYTLLNAYPGPRGTLWHMDFFRLEDAGQIVSLGLDDYLPAPEGVTLVEWSDRFPEALPPGSPCWRFAIAAGARLLGTAP